MVALGLLVGIHALPAAGAVPQGGGPVARFGSPTVRLGEIVAYELSWRHPADQTVILPDSAADFRPFELVRRRWHPTSTVAGQSLDRVTYYLRTFAPDAVQRLALAGRILTPRGDTMVVPGRAAQIRLRLVVPAVRLTQPPALRPQLMPLPVTARFNWPWLVAGFGGVALLLLALWLGYGRTLRARYRRYRLRKNHQYFLAQYARYVERFELTRSVPNLERVITLWKNYLTGLEGRPISSLTTKEIVAVYQSDERVAGALRLGDRAIYGNQLSDADDDTSPDPEAAALGALRTFAEERYAYLTTLPISYAPTAASLA